MMTSLTRRATALRGSTGNGRDYLVDEPMERGHVFEDHLKVADSDVDQDLDLAQHVVRRGSRDAEDLSGVVVVLVARLEHRWIVRQPDWQTSGQLDFIERTANLV